MRVDESAESEEVSVLTEVQKIQTQLETPEQSTENNLKYSYNPSKAQEVVEVERDSTFE
jgi:hypothetical protein